MPQKTNRVALAGADPAGALHHADDCAVDTRETVKNQPAARKWEAAVFRIKLYDGAHALRHGSVWHSWAIYYRPRGRFRVTHLPSGRCMTEFNRLAIARRWC
jgi:hypothetical protein